MNNFEEKIISKLKHDYRLKIEDANFAKGLIPVKILLDRTRNIHSYIVVCEKEGNIIESPYWDENNFVTNLKSMLALQFSDLDRPLFFIFESENKLKTIEGNCLREAILENQNMDINKYILDNSFLFNDIITRIHKEL